MTLTSLGTAAPDVPPARIPPANLPTIVYLCRVLWNGGVQRVAIDQVEGLQSQGWPVDLLFLRSTPDSAYSLPTRTTVLRTGHPTDRNLLGRLGVALTRRYARHRGPDAAVDLDLLWDSRRIVAEHELAIYNDQYAAILGIYLRLTRRQPYVVTFHEFYPKVRGRGDSSRLWAIADLFDRLSLLVAPAVITHSSKVFEGVEQWVPGRTTLIRASAVPPSRPLPPLRDRDRHAVLAITVWDRGRRPEVYLRIAERNPSFRFTLAGIWADPAYRREVEEAARPLPNLVVTGPISEEARTNLLAASMIYLRLGFGESGPGIGGLEALAAGSLVICNRGLGLSELLTHGTNGWILEDPVEDSATALLESLAQEPIDRLAHVGKQAEALAASLSSDRAATQLAGTLLALGNPRRKSRALQDPGPVESRPGGDVTQDAKGGRA